MNETRNGKNLPLISTAVDRVAVSVIRTDEELMIARSVCRALELGKASEKRDSDHATKYISRLDPFSAGGGPHKPRRGDIPDQKTYLRRGILAVGIRAGHGATDFSNTL